MMTNQRMEVRLRSRGRFSLVTDDGQCIDADLVDTSPSGVCVRTSLPIESGTGIQMHCGGVEFAAGGVRHCRPCDRGFFVGISFDDEHATIQG